MQNTSVGTKGTSKQLHNVSDSLRDSAEHGSQAASEYAAKAKHMASDTADAAGEYYERASSWLEQNYGKTLGIAGFLAAAGVIGYLIGRNNSRSEYPNSLHHS